jgi:phthalate 4,5-dioxygenase
MLTKEDNAALTRVGFGTPMGQLMRRYWVPALLSCEIPVADCPPVRVKLLGENLVAFRDSQSRIGLLDEFCAHRRASLFLGRNEESGLRCVYHGWKYDVEGNCLHTPNEAPESRLKDKIHLKAYPTAELGGVVWAYMGPQEKKPALPKFEWTQVPESHRHVTKIRQECNWLQALEGGIDTSHSSFLHRKLSVQTSREGVGPGTYHARVTAPIQEVDLTDYGFIYTSVRSLGEEGDYVRIYHYVLPFHQLRAYQIDYQLKPKKPEVSGHMWVPMDDENSMVYSWTYTFGEEPISDKERLHFDHHTLQGPDQRTDDFTKIRNKEAAWLIDRNVQKTETFTGIDGFTLQDHAIQESMGPIVDRTEEHLGSSDKAVVAARLLLLKAVKSVQADSDPPGIESTYHHIRAIEKVLPKGLSWKDTLRAEIFIGS